MEKEGHRIHVNMSEEACECDTWEMPKKCEPKEQKKHAGTGMRILEQQEAKTQPSAK
jgi:hypothetical protein